MTSNTNGKRSLEEMLAQANEQILGKWSTLASLIRLNEYDERDTKDWSKGWHPSREKAIYLLNTNTAEHYIDKIRDRFSNSIVQTMEIETQEVEPVMEKPSESPKSTLSIYEKNYVRLVNLIPDLEDRIIDGKTLNGVSNIAGYQGIILLKQIHVKNHVAEVQLFHYIEDIKSYHVETMNSLRIDIGKMQVESIAFNCKKGSSLVYHTKNGLSNELLDRTEQERQNNALKSLLKNLLLNKHSFHWVDDSKDDLFYKIDGFRFYFEPPENDDDEEYEIEECSMDDVNEILTEVIVKQNELEEKIKKHEDERREKIERKRNKVPEHIAFERWKERINDEIPDFETGEVQLVDAHKVIGITQGDIDWINKNRQGMVKIPHKDALKTYRNRGHRICAKGKVYFNGRSRR